MEKLRILVLEHGSEVSNEIRTLLSGANEFEFTLESVKAPKEVAPRIAEHPCDVLFIDMDDAGSLGLASISPFQELCRQNLPLIGITQHENKSGELELIKSGAQDYLVRSGLDADKLTRSIHYSIERHRLLEHSRLTHELMERKNQRLARLYATSQQLVDSVSIDFRFPLTEIIALTTKMRTHLEDNAEPVFADTIKGIESRADDLVHLIDDMLDIRKLEAGLVGIWRQPTMVHEIIESVESHLAVRAKLKRIGLTCKVAPDLPQVFCDAEKVSRVITNLAVNAIKFTPPGGTVEIWARRGKDPSEIQIGITDNGPGISGEDLEPIYKRFRQNSTEGHTISHGVGTGLNIAKELVSLNLGELHVESVLFEGSTFYFTLPCYKLQNIFQRYVNRVIGNLANSSEVSLFTVELQPSYGTHLASKVDEFLQKTLRSADLVLHVGNYQWILAANCPRLEVTRLINRVLDDWKTFVASCTASQMPDLALMHQGNWEYPIESAQLQIEFLSLLDRVQGESRTTPSIPISGSAVNAFAPFPAPQ